MSLFFFFDSFVASYSATSNLASSFSLLGFNSPILNILDGFDLRSFNSVGSNLVGFNLATSEFDNKSPFFYDTPPASLTSRFFLLGPPGSLSIPGYNFNLHVRLSLLLSYFKPHFNSCQVCFADNLPNFRRNLSLSNLAMSAFSNSYLHHYISFVPSLQLHCSLESNYLILNNLQSSCLQLDSFGPTYLPSISLPDQVTIPSNLPSLSSQDLNSNGGIFFQFSLPKLRLSSRSFALYLSKPSSLLPVPLAYDTFSPNDSVSATGDSHIPDFNRSFYSQNLPSFVGLLGSFIHSSIGDSTSPVGNSIDISTSSISCFASNSDPLSTCELSSLHHFLNLRSRTASFFGFLDSFFLFDSPFLDSLPWDSFSLRQNPSCFPSQLHTPSNEFSLFDEELFLANNSFFPFGNLLSCLHKQHFSLQQDLFYPFNHNCSSYKQHFPLHKEHFLLGEEHFLANNSIFTSNVAFPSTSFHLLQPYLTFLAFLTHASAFTASFKTNFISNFKTYSPTSLSLHCLSVNFGNFASSPNSVNLADFFTFSHSTQLDIYHLLDKSCYCPSANLHFSQFNNSSILSHYFSNLSNLVTHNHLTFNNYFFNSSYLVLQNQLFSCYFFSYSAYLAIQNHLTFSYFFCNPANLVIYNSVFLTTLFCNPANLVMQSDAFYSYFFCNLSNLVTHNHLTFNNLACNSAYLAFQNHLTFNNLHHSKSTNLHFGYVILSNLHCQNQSNFVNCPSVLNNLACPNQSILHFTLVSLSNLHHSKSTNLHFSPAVLSNLARPNHIKLHNCSSISSDLVGNNNAPFTNSPSFKTLLRNYTRSFYSSKLTKTSHNLSKKASSMRSHYRIKMSFEGKVPSHFAISLARNYLLQQFPNAILLASCHQNTNHTHIHVLLFARDVDGKKLHFSNSNYKKLDIGWAKIYSRVFGEHKFQQHIDKKAQSRSWKRDRMMGIERDKPHRISLTNRHQQQFQQQQHQFQQQFHQQQQHQLNAPINHYKQLQLTHNFNHILPFKHLQLVHNIDHKQLHNQLSSNHFGTNIELNQPYNQLSSNHFGLNFELNQLHKQLYNKTFDLNIVQNHHLFNIFDKHFDKYLDFNSCRFYGLSLNDGVHFNKFDSIFVAKDLSFLAQDRVFDTPFDRISNNVFVDKQPSVDNKLHPAFDNSIDKTTFVVGKQLSVADKLPSIFDKHIDKTASVADKNVLHFYINPVPSAPSMNNNSPIDKDLVSLRPSTNLSQLHLHQQNLIHQLQHQQHNQQQRQYNFNQNLSQQRNLDLHSTNLNQQPELQDLHQHQHNHLYNQTHLIPPPNLTPLSSDTYLDLIHTLDSDYNDRFSDRVIDDRVLNEREINEKLNGRDFADSKIVDGDACRKIIDTDIDRDNIHHIDNDINRDIDRDDFDEPDR